MARHSATFTAMGFSTSTWQPASSAPTLTSPCKPCGRATTTASGPDASSSPYEAKPRAPRAAAARSRRSSSASQILAISKKGTWARASTWLCRMAPAPMMPRLICADMSASSRRVSGNARRCDPTRWSRRRRETALASRISLGSGYPMGCPLPHRLLHHAPAYRTMGSAVEGGSWLTWTREASNPAARSCTRWAARSRITSCTRRSLDPVGRAA